MKEFVLTNHKVNRINIIYVNYTLLFFLKDKVSMVIMDKTVYISLISHYMCTIIVYPYQTPFSYENYSS